MVERTPKNESKRSWAEQPPSALDFHYKVSHVTTCSGSSGWYQYSQEIPVVFFPHCGGSHVVFSSIYL